ncbi:MAG: hypothetical protein KC496_00195 [Anaerolineae bacterium]|nr:hypothetical protein [Anaerolineae bacterium]
MMPNYLNTGSSLLSDLLNFNSPYIPNSTFGAFSDVSGNALSAGTPDWFSKENIFGDGKTPGWGGTALGLAQGIGNAFMGMQQYGLAKKAFEESKRQYNQNYAAQRQTINTALEDRQRARVASNAGAYQSVGDYMYKNAVV